MMRVMVIGKTGQLSRCLQDEAKAMSGVELIVVPSEDVQGSCMIDLLAFHCPHAIINTAALTDIPECEDDFDRAYSVNARLVQGLISARYRFLCKRITKEGHETPQYDTGCHIYTISTDYVFDGISQRTGGSRPRATPYCTWDKPRPLNNYGLTKRAAEIICAASPHATVIRTASLFSQYGSTGKGGSNFLLGMLEKAAGDEQITVDDDVVMSPTYTPWLARGILYLVTKRPHAIPGFEVGVTGTVDRVGPPAYPPKLIHLVCDGPPVSWYEFAKAIFEAGGINVDGRFSRRHGDALVLEPPWPARPHYSALAPDANIRLGTWQAALADYFDKHPEEDNER